MKKICLVTVLILFLTFTGCSAKENSSKKLVEESKQLYVTEYNTNNYISIQIPNDCFDEAQKTFIKEFVYKTFEVTTDNKFNLEYSTTKPKSEDVQEVEYYIEVETRVTYFTDEFVSVVFDGFFNKSHAAHPINLFFTLNFNPKTLERVYFLDKYEMNDELYDLFSEQAEKNLIKETGGVWPNDWGSFSEDIFSKESFFNGLKNEKNIYSSIYCYYTDNAVGFSYECAHALGDHREVEILYKDIHSKKTD